MKLYCGKRQHIGTHIKRRVLPEELRVALDKGNPCLHAFSPQYVTRTVKRNVKNYKYFPGHGIIRNQNTTKIM